MPVSAVDARVQSLQSDKFKERLLAKLTVLWFRPSASCEFGPFQFTDPKGGVSMIENYLVENVTIA